MHEWNTANTPTWLSVPLMCTRRQRRVKTKRILIADPARNYEQAGRQVTFLRLKDRHCLPCHRRADFEVSRVYICRKQGLPFERCVVGRKNGGASAEKKSPGNAKSHLKPPGSGSSFEGPGWKPNSIRRRIHTYIYLSPLYIGICT